MLNHFDHVFSATCETEKLAFHSVFFSRPGKYAGAKKEHSASFRNKHSSVRFSLSFFESVNIAIVKHFFFVFINEAPSASFMLHLFLVEGHSDTNLKVETYLLDSSFVVFLRKKFIVVQLYSFLKI